MPITKKLLLAAGSIAILAIVIVLFLVFKPHGTGDLDSVLKEGRIRIVTDNSTLGFKTEKDSVFGFQYEIAKEFAKFLGVELEISEDDDVHSAIKNLTENDYDVVAMLLPVTSEHNENVLFTKKIQVNRSMLVQLKSDTSKLVTKHYQLANDTIFLTKNSPFELTIKHLSDQIADTIHIAELKNATIDIAVKMVSEGIISYTVCPERYAKKLLETYPNLDITVPVGFQQYNAWAVQKNAVELHKKLNEFLTDFIGSEAYWKIYRKYY
jgi:membrane-bound lytic murein transglycosylase F